jgi:hypothetical protein
VPLDDHTQQVWLYIYFLNILLFYQIKYFIVIIVGLFSTPKYLIE